MRRLISACLLGTVALLTAGCHHKVSNPIANVNSKQPDKVLYDRAMEAMRKGKWDVARLTLQTLINTYPDSEFVARAKLSVGDSWYAEGTTTALQQAEIEYRDFETFFPNMPEAAEAQLKIATIHYKQMEKPDRDFTHAKRAEEEYRQLLQQYPDSKLVPEAKQKLRDVQEVLAEREYRIGRFYFLRESYPAAIARLRSLTDNYPLYSGADSALLMLGNAYEKEIDLIRAGRAAEVSKGRLIEDFTKSAAEAYTRLINRYPISEEAKSARERLTALHRPVPTPTAEAIAQNRAEEESRRETGKVGKVMLNFKRRPDVAQAAHVGEPSLNPGEEASAPEIMKRAERTAVGSMGGDSDNHSVSVETVGRGAPPPNEATPRTEEAQPSTPAPNVAPPTGGSSSNSAPSSNQTGIEDLPVTGGSAPAAPGNSGPAAPANSAPAAPAARPPSANSAPAAATPAANEPAPLPPPTQINEAAQEPADQASSAPSSSTSGKVDKKTESTSKRKKKKKLIIF
ncbi:MAG TPA: outer membrane protein assembly factor BamD [Terriglobales bacterium]|nr:outer membrane protein assembly factor BamD [Terriglobales bacterium]